MSKRAEKKALMAYPVVEICLFSSHPEYGKFDVNDTLRYVYQQGYEQAEKDTIERIIEYLDECDLERTILDFDSDGYANIYFESLEKLIRKAMEEE